MKTGIWRLPLYVAFGLLTLPVEQGEAQKYEMLSRAPAMLDPSAESLVLPVVDTPPVLPPEQAPPAVPEEQALPAVAEEQALPTVPEEQALPAVPEEQVLPAVPEEQALPAVAEEQPLPTMIIADLELADTVETATLLRMMARLADVNMLISPGVQGSVGFTFRGIAWDQAFRSILSTTGLTYVWQGSVLRVMTLEDLQRELQLETVLRDRDSIREESRLTEPMMMRVIPLNYLMATKVETTVKMMLAVDEGGVSRSGLPLRKATVSADSESNSIIVHAIRSDVEKASALIQELDQPRPLIQIEAKIVEATRDAARQLGMQWSGKSTRLDGDRLVGVSGGAATAGGYMSDFPAQFVNSETLPQRGLSLAMSSERLGAGEFLNLQLTALQQEGQINIESSPVVTTLDNETAVIESGEERAYQSSSGTGSDTVLEWKEAVLKLEVTPHVVDGKLLRVKIVSNKDSFDETKPQTNNEFPVNKKRALTTVVLADGETTMIGGFAIESSSDSMTGVPFLMRIPLLGALFRNKSTGGRFDETIIFITPKIL